MRLGRIIVNGFISRHGIQIELGVWVKSYYWLCLLVKALFGYAFFGLAGVEGGAVAYGLERHGTWWEFTWSRYDKEREARIKQLVLKTLRRRRHNDL